MYHYVLTIITPLTDTTSKTFTRSFSMPCDLGKVSKDQRLEFLHNLGHEHGCCIHDPSSITLLQFDNIENANAAVSDILAMIDQANEEHFAQSPLLAYAASN